MSIDWGHAFYIGGIGFGTVFVVLGILAAALAVTAVAVQKISRTSNKDSIQEGE